MQDNNSESFAKIMEYEQQIHEKNQKRIKIGIRLVLIIPLIFLFVMFKLDSSKVVFLVLWIVSLFGISIYLIGVEYMDYQLQIKLSELGIREDKPIEGLLQEDSKVEKLIVNAGLLEDSKESNDNEIVQKEKSEHVEVEEVLPSENLSDAEEELVQSIRKYVAVLSKQSVEQGTMTQVTPKSPQDYAAMRRARALEKHEKEKE